MRPIIADGHTLWVSHEYMRELRSTMASGVAHPVDMFAGMEVRETAILPYDKPDKSKPPISRDRWAEYDANDMEWAEPLGLARWQREVVHCSLMKNPKPLNLYDFSIPSRFVIQFT